MAAPALAASIAAFAICSGVIGKSGCVSAVSPAPVTAQVMMTSEFMMMCFFDNGSWVRDLCELYVSRTILRG